MPTAAETHGTFTTQFIAKLEREREEALQEAGRLRARVDELEDGLRALLSWYEGTDVDPDTPIWRARVALGLDGSTGHRDVNAEASHG